MNHVILTIWACHGSDLRRVGDILQSQLNVSNVVVLLQGNADEMKVALQIAVANLVGKAVRERLVFV